MTQSLETRPRTEAHPPPAKRRDPFFDNAKFFAIILVVVGHMLSDMRGDPVVRPLYQFIYMFHMPVFILLAGYMSRNFSFSSGKAQRLITVLLVPYLIFEVAYSLLHRVAVKPDHAISLFDPFYLTWFLLALFIWRVSTPVWLQLRWPVLIAVLVSVFSGTEELGAQLDLHRVLGFLPFYVLGLSLRPEHFEWLRRPAVRVLGAVTLAAGLGVAFLVQGRMSMEWVFWRRTNDYLGVDDLTGSVMRLGMLLSAAILVAAFLAVVPARWRWFTRLGAATIYAYLLHGFAVRAWRYPNMSDADWAQSPLGIVAVAAIGVALAVLLCTPPVQRVFHWAVEPRVSRMSWLFTRIRRPAAPGPAPASAPAPAADAADAANRRYSPPDPGRTEMSGR